VSKNNSGIAKDIFTTSDIMIVNTPL